MWELNFPAQLSKEGEFVYLLGLISNITVFCAVKIKMENHFFIIIWEIFINF
jgi:hypothetical protein